MVGFQSKCEICNFFYFFRVNSNKVREGKKVTENSKATVDWKWEFYFLKVALNFFFFKVKNNSVVSCESRMLELAETQRTWRCHPGRPLAVIKVESTAWRPPLLHMPLTELTQSKVILFCANDELQLQINSYHMCDTKKKETNHIAAA